MLVELKFGTHSTTATVKSSGCTALNTSEQVLDSNLLLGTLPGRLFLLSFRSLSWITSKINNFLYLTDFHFQLLYCKFSLISFIFSLFYSVELSWYVYGVILIVHNFGWVIYRASTSQKAEYRKNPLKPSLAREFCPYLFNVCTE